jgi:hypothetical protein
MASEGARGWERAGGEFAVMGAPSSFAASPLAGCFGENGRNRTKLFRDRGLRR